MSEPEFTNWPPAALTQAERTEQIMRLYWNDTFAKNYPIRFFLRAGVSSGALMLAQYERRFRVRLGDEAKEIFA